MSEEDAEKRIMDTLGAVTPLSGGGLHELTGIPVGALYPALSRLEEAGAVTSDWETPLPHEDGQPRRLLYSVVR